jgi:hypothetical protein
MFISDPGSDFFPSLIPDPNFFHPGSRISIEEFEYFNPILLLKISVADPGCSSRIRILTFYPSRIPDPGVKKAPDPKSLLNISLLVRRLSRFMTADALTILSTPVITRKPRPLQLSSPCQALPSPRVITPHSILKVCTYCF